MTNKFDLSDFATASDIILESISQELRIQNRVRLSQIKSSENILLAISDI